ncbi:glycoside hydrolase superfamily [Scenedesmus sp. NREL 46B-D3]|nr:glycoside hydrolase superfamily [Scenedesmus sp. NREL 46B-D3]
MARQRAAATMLLICCLLAAVVSAREVRQPSVRNVTRRSLPGAAGRPFNISRPRRIPRIRQTCSAVTYDQPPRGRPAPPVELRGDQFVTVSDGQTVAMHGVNWFGFNNRMTFLNGLWAGQASANSDFAAIIWQLKLLGFNSIRLPFLFEDLQAPAQPISGYCTHESTLAELANRTVDPQYSVAIRRAPPTPAVSLPRVAEPGSCNKYIPPAAGGKTMERFLWTVQWLVSNGFYVLIDYHPMGMEKTSYDAAAFVEAWKQVWASVTCLPNFRRDMVGRVFVDILNEPDSQWQTWQPKDGKAGMTELYLGVMDALWAMTPGAPIFFVNGGGQGNYAGLNWGNGFVTDKAIIADWEITDANPFFQALMQRPYLSRVVISPHLYGPSVSHRKDFYKGAEWMSSLDKSFGYLGKEGYCHNGKCHVFPIAVGEFGSRFENPEDLSHLNDLALYMNAQGSGNTGGHRPVASYFYWCYNANSGDTGGLVDDSWMTLQWVKLRYLMDNLGLTPWYKPRNNRRRPASAPAASSNSTASTLAAITASISAAHDITVGGPAEDVDVDVQDAATTPVTKTAALVDAAGMAAPAALAAAITTVADVPAAAAAPAIPAS